DLVGTDWNDIEAVARRELTPTLANGGQPAIVFHSGTPLKKFFEAEVNSLAAGGSGEDVPTYLETRSVSLSRDGDLVLGRTPPWRQAVDQAAVEGLEVPLPQYYYLTHALLVLAANFATDRNGCIEHIIRRLRSRPEGPIRVYVLDRETQLLL